MPQKVWKLVVLLLLVIALGASFWLSAGWTQLCAGLALFLFGMQCLEEGLRQLAGSKLEQILGRSTSTPLKSMAFGFCGTLVLQSTTLVSLLTIAFISTGLIQLAGGIAILFGANLGATSGIWLLALAGQNLSLSPLAMPLLVFGVLASFAGPKSKAAGRVVMGVAFIFLGIDLIKEGFASFGDTVDMTQYHASGLAGHVIFTLVGILITVVLQSSHASLMLTIAALATGQLELEQALAVAIGSNMGSSVTTAIMGSLSGNRGGQRLALAHVLFNCVTGLLAFILLSPLTWLVVTLAAAVGLGDNTLIQLAMFHTLFNSMGVLIFWPGQNKLAQLLTRWLPDREEPKVLITDIRQQPMETHARYLNDRALDSVEAASMAVAQELRHMSRLSLEVICHALYLPIDQLAKAKWDNTLLESPPPPVHYDAEKLYQLHVKGVYADLLSFMGRMELPMDEAHQQFWLSCQVAAVQLVDAVKDAKHLQKNLGYYLAEPSSPARGAYVDLRRHMLASLHDVRELSLIDVPDDAWHAYLRWFDGKAASFDAEFRKRLFEGLKQNRFSGMQTASLMNDVGYVSRIIQSLRNVLMLTEEQELFRELRKQQPIDEDHLIALD